RYLAQCQVDAVALLAQVCREASNAPSGGSIWVTPAQRQARQELPLLASAWATQLAHPVAPKAPAISVPIPFFASGFSAPSGLSLMSDDDVDEDIESTRVVQAIEGAAEWSLRDLRSRLASAPPVAGGTRDDTLPLAPARVVGALCATLHDAALDPAVRLAALRMAADPLARTLANLYQQHAEMLNDWGLQPARYTIRREPEARPAGGARGATGGGPVGKAGGVGVASGQIPALLAQVAGEAGLSTGMQALMARLAGPVARSVAADQRLLDSVDNPLWRLIDRLAALGQLDTNVAPGSLELPLHLRLEPIIAGLEAAVQPMTAERYAQALAEAEAEAHDVAGASAHTTTPTSAMPLAGAVSPPVVSGSPTAVALSADRQRQELEPVMRAQMAARLRDDPVLPEVRQFLLGPWLQVVVKAYVEQGEEAPATQRVLGAVESFIDAGSYRRRTPLRPAELDCLRMEAEDGLLKIGQMPGERVQQHVLDLRQALAVWPLPAPDTEFSALLDEPDEEAPPDSDAWPSHDELATVPIALDAHNPDERSLRDCEAWLDSLAAGDICRIQRQGQWATLRLNWRSDTGTYFAFGNSTGLAFCASRRVLGRMRLEGLATTMARGQWVRRAVDTLPMPLE
ncbi:MAG TPA: DUF1631 family protein, partial [Ideonella sp.]|uniref:DUF1631 family protein n=1 Tax=Ideonella sp. TaxID=1929293 RepID=UPI002E37359D